MLRCEGKNENKKKEIITHHTKEKFYDPPTLATVIIRFKSNGAYEPHIVSV